jgi:hypothetical protein
MLGLLRSPPEGGKEFTVWALPILIWAGRLGLVLKWAQVRFWIRVAPGVNQDVVLGLEPSLD